MSMNSSFDPFGARKKKVLLIEDEVVIRQHLKEFIESDEVFVVESGNGLEAIEMIRKGGIDFVITDVSLPGIAGDEMLRRLVAEGNSTPIALMSGQLHLTKRSAKALGAVGYFEKPMEILEIPEFVSQYLLNGKN